MRWKLILIVSVLASILGAAVTSTLLYLSFGSIQIAHARGLSLVVSCVAPALVVLLAGFFVYRHTARRRIVQALLTALIAVFLILSILLGSILLTQRRTPAISVMTEQPQR
jgi:RsiW-degrading membrane proteinase PrsW (M82 family)